MKKRILLACNTLTAIGAGPYMDHTKLCYRLGRDFKQYDFMQMNARRLSIDRFRNTCAQFAKDSNCEYILFIDDDMHLASDVFPLLEAAMKKEKFDILAALAYVRGYPFDPMVYRYRETEPGTPRGLAAVSNDIIEEAKGEVITCDAIGTATCLIRVSTAIKKVPGPWFITGPHNTEDIYFCIKAKEYYKKLKIGCHTGAITGHLLDPEVVSKHTRPHLIDYYESYMGQMEKDLATKGEHSVGYVDEIKKIIDGEKND